MSDEELLELSDKLEPYLYEIVEKAGGYLSYNIKFEYPFCSVLIKMK